MTTALEPYRKQAGDLDGEHATTVAALAELDSFAVANDDDATFAADLIREVKGKHRQLDDRRKEVTGPLNATVKTINGWFKPALDALETAERRLKSQVAMFVQERERQTREALASRRISGHGLALARHRRKRRPSVVLRARCATHRERVTSRSEKRKLAADD